jgi:hypothetical protein
MFEYLPSPNKIPQEEWTKPELDRGEKFPDYIVGLRARVKSPEQEEIYVHLERAAEDLKKRLAEAYPEPWTFSPDKLHDVLRIVENELIGIAYEARQLTDHYGGFGVGTCVIGLRNVQRSENPWRIVFDANTKPTTVMGEIRKHCSELHAMDRIDPDMQEMGIDEDKMDKALAFFVVGQARGDDHSEIKQQITLTPCKLCRDRLWKMSQQENPVISEDMPVVTANANNLALRKSLPVEYLHDFHKERRPNTAELD